MTFYNELDPYPAQWLENLIAQGLLPAGEVSRVPVQHLLLDHPPINGAAHFFAGIGGWPYALRLAGIPDSAPIWTGSCPCQPFSQSGKKRGFTDDRHLWPAWFNLIRECRPAVLFGEQVASPDGLAWLDLVSADLEGAGYAVGAADLCAAGIGAPHLRQRLFFVAYSHETGRELLRSLRISDVEDAPRGDYADGRGEGSVVESASGGRDQGSLLEPGPGERAREAADRAGSFDASRLVNPRQPGSGRNPGAIPPAQGRSCSIRLDPRDQPGATGELGHPDEQGREERECSPGERPTGERISLPTGALNFWSECDWIPCRTGKGDTIVYRPVEPGTFPLAHGIPSRVGRLRAYGNAIVPTLAAEFVRAAIESVV